MPDVPEPRSGLCIRTAEGWRLLGGPLAPAPEPAKWWHFPKAGKAFWRMFDEVDRRETSDG